MGKFTVFRLKNLMLFSNFISNAIGVSLTIFLSQNTGAPNSELEIAVMRQYNPIFLPISFIVPLSITFWYELPIRRYFNSLSRGDIIPGEKTVAVQRRLLNEPFVLIVINAMVWLAATTFYPTVMWMGGVGEMAIKGAFFRGLQGGMVTVTAAFFVLEFFLQYKLCPVIFPNGGLSRTPNTFRIRIRTRLVAFLLACNLIPLFIMARSAWTTIRQTPDPTAAAQIIYESVIINAIVFSAVGIWVTFLVSGILTRSIRGMVPALKAVREGRFDTTVRVTSNDELGYAGDVINDMTAGLKERDFIKESFGKYVSREIRDEILAQRIPLDGELKEVTLLFADLRNFTPLVERTSPRDVVRIINHYFEEMEKIISGHGGLILQFIGDEIEAVFGAPMALDDHPDKALGAALEMQDHLAGVNAILAEEGHPPLMHGIGVHTGEVVAANIGSPQRLSYALVGDAVNVAARLQDMNKQFGTHIIASESTMAQATGNYPLKPLPASQIRGRTQGISLYGI